MHLRRQFLIPVMPLLLAACGDEATAPSTIYLADAFQISAPSVAAAEDSVIVEFFYTLSGCDPVDGIETRLTFDSLSVAVWGRRLPPETYCLDVVHSGAFRQVLGPNSRAESFVLVIRQPGIDSVRTIVRE